MASFSFTSMPGIIRLEFCCIASGARSLVRPLKVFFLIDLFCGLSRVMKFGGAWVTRSERARPLDLRRVYSVSLTNSLRKR